MSLYGAMVSGILGLQAQQAGMGTISDNISNVNTVGYKRTGNQFSTLVTDAATPTSYTPGGVQFRPRQFVSSQGVLATSSSSTDIAVSGNGLMPVVTIPNTGPANGGAATLASGAQVLYTRAGNFAIDSNGNLKNAAGYYLQAWPSIPPGYTSFATNQTIQQLRTVNVSGLSGVATATSNITARANLQASTATSAYTASTPTTLNPATAPTAGMGAYINGNTATGVAPDFQRTFQVYDSQGTSHSIIFAFKHLTAAASGLSNNNGWVVEAYADLNGNGVYTALNTSLPNSTAANQLLVFNQNGTINVTNSTFLTNWGTAIGAANPSFGGTGIQWNSNNTANSVNAQNITLNWGTNNLADGFTMFDTTSALISSNVDGSVSGTFTGVSISDTGIVQALFDNGTRRNIYQIPLVTFTNPDGLKQVQGNGYVETINSGTANINVAGTGGAGLYNANSLEQSNVDLATEFTNMIVTQRAYSANGKTVTTVDEMLQEVINLKR